MEPPFDEAELLDRIEDDFEFLEETVDMLDEDVPDLLDAIRAAVETGDSDALVTPAHALKGMVANFCAAPAEQAARALEMMGREQRLDDAASAVTRMQEEIDRLRSALRDYLKARAS
jgi:HPt (histidine-containing phosphotransfer) domain-containing protein